MASGRPLASDTAVSDTNGFLLEWGGVGQIFLGESQSRLYPHMRAKFGRDPTFVSKKASLESVSRLGISVYLTMPWSTQLLMRYLRLTNVSSSRVGLTKLVASNEGNQV